MKKKKTKRLKNDAKRKAPKHAFAQNKEIGALLQQASDMMQQDSDRAKIFFETKMDVFGGGDSSLTADVDRVKITCTAPGGDDACTYSIRMLRDRLCAPGWDEPRTSFSAKIIEDESRLYYVAFEIDQITNCADVIP